MMVINPIASTSKLPYLAHARPFSTSPAPLSSTRPTRLRLTPTTRTRLTNLSFAAAVAVSVLTVSLAMSGATTSVTGVGLPCPARKDGARGVRSEEEPGKGGSDWWKATKSRHRFMDDPVPSGGNGLRSAREGREGAGAAAGTGGARAAVAKDDTKNEGWTAWARRNVGC